MSSLRKNSTYTVDRILVTLLSLDLIPSKIRDFNIDDVWNLQNFEDYIDEYTIKYKINNNDTT